MDGFTRFYQVLPGFTGFYLVVFFIFFWFFLQFPWVALIGCGLPLVSWGGDGLWMVLPGFYRVCTGFDRVLSVFEASFPD